jgi:hypothetical protein
LDEALVELGGYLGGVQEGDLGDPVHVLDYLDDLAFQPVQLFGAGREPGAAGLLGRVRGVQATFGLL